MSRLHRPLFVSLLVATGASADPAIRFANGENCYPKAAHFQLDQFDSMKNASQNVLGGNWYAYTDSTSPKPVDSMTGTSHLDLLAGKAWAPWSVGQVGFGAVRATLEKKVAGAYHKNAGWVRLATNFGIDENGGNFNVQFPLAGMNALSFRLFVGSAGGMLPDSLKWDPDKVPDISLRVSVMGVGDEFAYAIKIPVDEGVGNTICVDLDSLKQPRNFIDADPWDPSHLINEIAFEAKITDQLDSSVHSAGPITFAVKDVEIYGLTLRDAWCSELAMASSMPDPNNACGPGDVKGRPNSKSTLRAAYSNGLTISYNLPGINAQLDILRLDGSRVARLQIPASATNLHLSQTLTRGTYMLALRGEGATQVVPLTVAR